MSTQCNTKQIEFLPFKSLETSRNSPGSKRTRKVIAKFDSDKVSSDGGVALLREAEHRFGVIRRFAECFIDHRNPNYITHPVFSIVAQRVLAICCGYEDVNDHDRFRSDPLASMFCGTSSPLAGKSTVNRMELGEPETDRYKKIVADFCAIERQFVELFRRFHGKAPRKIVLDIDVTDDPVHGNQEGKFYHGYYGGYCYAPSYIFCGRHLLGCQLREANQDSAAGATEELERIVSQIREKWKNTRIIIRGDAGFCRDELMSWCEGNGVDYVLGMGRTSRLMKRVKKQARKAQVDYMKTKRPSRRFASFWFRTKKSWSCRRRVVCKAEHLERGSNTRFIVTSLGHQEYDARTLYEKVYCARGEMENRIKAQQLQLFSDRTSTHYMRSNQLRMYFSAFAYILMECVRREGLRGTRYAMAQCDTIRLKLIKIGTVVRTSARRVVLSFSESYPYQNLFRQVLWKLQKVSLG